MSSLVTLHEPYFQLTDNNGNNQDEVEKPVEGRADTGADGFGLVPKKKKKTLVSVCGVFLSETMFSSSVWSVSMVSAFTDQSG